MRIRSLMVTLLSACFAVPLFATSPFFRVTIDVSNQSDTCAWVTIYGSRPGAAWAIVGGPARPRFVKANSFHRFSFFFDNLLGFPYPAEVKVRSEFMKNTKCDGPVVADRESYKRVIMVPLTPGGHEDLKSGLLGKGVGYTVGLGK